MHNPFPTWVFLTLGCNRALCHEGLDVPQDHHTTIIAGPGLSTLSCIICGVINNAIDSSIVPVDFQLWVCPPTNKRKYLAQSYHISDIRPAGDYSEAHVHFTLYLRDLI